MIADLFSLYSCWMQSATKFSNCLYRACNCSNVIVYRRQPVSSIIPRGSTGREITRLIPYFILLLDYWGRLPGPGVRYLSDANIFFEKQIGHSFGHFVFALNIFVECSLINAHRIIFNNNGDFVKVGVKSLFCDVLFHCLNLYRESARAVGFIIEPGYKYSAFFLKPKIFS